VHLLGVIDQQAARRASRHQAAAPGDQRSGSPNRLLPRFPRFDCDWADLQVGLVTGAILRLRSGGRMLPVRRAGGRVREAGWRPLARARLQGPPERPGSPGLCSCGPVPAGRLPLIGGQQVGGASAELGEQQVRVDVGEVRPVCHVHG
jgi:hypothetical protein